ncbi:hypothetical protein CRUP_005800 [Coryphaenoides rupestris]|nr:hypothetical protein CRUP_005800 [Coryphaenoides rupestris]
MWECGKSVRISPWAVHTRVLNQILVELHSFLLILDKENLSGNATVQKGLLLDLLLSYRGANGGDEYIYMNKVTAPDDKGEWIQTI